MAIVIKPDMSYGVWADGGNIEIPSSEKVEQGWVVEKPLNEWMNWLQNRQDRMLAYLNQRGISEWDFRTDYPVDALVAREGTIYQAISQNTDEDPTLNLAVWEIAFVSYSEFVDYSVKINNIESQEGYLGLYVSKAFPVMTGIAKGISYNNSTGVSGYDFDGLKPKVINNGLTVAEFSGGANPKDVVTHEQLALAIQNYRVGDIYITMGGGDPSARLGYGTWERFAEGKTLVGLSTSISNDTPQWLKTVGDSFGDYTHKLTVDEIPSHSHKTSISLGGVPDVEGFEKISNWNGHANDGITDSYGNQKSTTVGGDLPHNIVQPSIVVYFWKRVA